VVVPKTNDSMQMTVVSIFDALPLQPINVKQQRQHKKWRKTIKRNLFLLKISVKRVYVLFCKLYFFFYISKNED